MGNSNSNVIVDTETRSTVWPGMVQSSSRMKDMQRTLLFGNKTTTFRQTHQGAEANQRASNNERSDFVHFWQKRSITFGKAIIKSQVLASMKFSWICPGLIKAGTQFTHCINIFCGMNQC